MTTPTLLKRFVAWLQKLSFRTGVVVLAMCIPCYIASFAQAVFPISYGDERYLVGYFLRISKGFPILWTRYIGC